MKPLPRSARPAAAPRLTAGQHGAFTLAVQS